MFKLYINGKNPLTLEEGEETRVPGETPDDELQKMPHTKAQKCMPRPRLELTLYLWLPNNRGEHGWYCPSAQSGGLYPTG